MPNTQHCILFYKYHPLTSNPTTLDRYRQSQQELCESLSLTGRILLGLSENGEGINGTLAGSKDDLEMYVNCMLGTDYGGSDPKRKDTASKFRTESQAFFAQLNIPELIFSTPNDFKWSSSTSSDENNTSWFPDLNIKMVKEIISTGGAFSDITMNETSVGYLTPKQWHEEMKLLMNQSSNDGDRKEEEVETILIDVRNHKECQIGTFAPGIAIDPNTKTFAQFPKYVRDHSGGGKECKSNVDGLGTGPSGEAAATASTSLDNKRILLYCTGGIRCEKASAYIRQMVPQNKGVYHLKGGIHKYLDEFGTKDECTFIGKNFVFDRRGAMDANDCLSEQNEAGDNGDSNAKVLGRCFYCKQPHDTFLPENICTVCREPVLACPQCVTDLYIKQQTLRRMDGNNSSEKQQNIRVEFHCEDHFQLKTCYYTSLHGFSVDELNEQMKQLQLHSKQFEGIGKKGKQRRRTIRKQMGKIQSFIKAVDSNNGDENVKNELSCRHCGSTLCASDCWGFHGGNLRMTNKERTNPAEPVKAKNHSDSQPMQRVRTPSNHRPAKRLKREKELNEIETLQLCKAASEYRLSNGLRIPPPSVRVLRSSVKGRWCGKSLRDVMTTEFRDFATDTSPLTNSADFLDEIINANLLRINGVPVSQLVGGTEKASEILLRNMDTLERIVHWHEPPICVPARISLTKHSLPGVLSRKDASTTNEGNSDIQSPPLLYCVNKPSSVPVHPAGPYYANSLLLMVEAQESLSPKSLIPCHRIDRCTSGVLLCTNSPDVARIIQGAMTSSATAENGKSTQIKKLYLARVKGKFPNSPSESLNNSIPGNLANISSLTWHGDNILEVSAPIAVQLSGNSDEMNQEEAATMMHRIVSSDGKHAISRFKLISYDPTTNESLVSCCPVTGRGHQLRVHLQFIGFPIHNDVEYGGTHDPEKAQEASSIQSILDLSKMSECNRDEAVSHDEAEAAVSMCRVCHDGERGVKASFQPAQLLLGGSHSIDLHAYKYSICLNHKMMDENGEKRNAMEFTAALPTWASTFDGVSPDDIAWLK